MTWPLKEREAAYAAAFRVVCSDGRLSPNERLFLGRVAEELGLPPHRRTEIETALRTGGRRPPYPATPEGKRLLFGIAVRAAVADGRIVRKERELLQRLGLGTGVPRDEVDWAIRSISGDSLGADAAEEDGDGILDSFGSHRPDDRAVRRRVTGVLALANFLPFLGVLLLDWNPLDLLYLYGLELAVASFFSLLRGGTAERGFDWTSMSKVGRVDRALGTVAMAMCLFALCAGYFVVLSQGAGRLSTAFSGFDAASLSLSSPFLICLAFLVGGQAAAFFVHHVVREGYARVSAGTVWRGAGARAVALYGGLALGWGAGGALSIGLDAAAGAAGAEADTAGTARFAATAALAVVAVVKVAADVAVWGMELGARRLPWHAPALV